MVRYGIAACLVLAVGAFAGHNRTTAADAPVTFSKDVLPILQKNCQSCHRPGQMAPMALRANNVVSVERSGRRRDSARAAASRPLPASPAM